MWVKKQTHTFHTDRLTEMNQQVGRSLNMEGREHGLYGVWEKEGGGSADRGGINPTYLIVHGTLVRAGING